MDHHNSPWVTVISLRMSVGSKRSPPNRLTPGAINVQRVIGDPSNWT